MSAVRTDRGDDGRRTEMGVVLFMTGEADCDQEKGGQEEQAFHVWGLSNIEKNGQPGYYRMIAVDPGMEVLPRIKIIEQALGFEKPISSRCGYV
jgi:hypothetical protein